MERLVWTTFSTDQIDLNFGSPALFLDVLEVLLEGKVFLRAEFDGFEQKGIGGPERIAGLGYLRIPCQRAGIDGYVAGNGGGAEIVGHVEFQRFADTGRHAVEEGILALLQSGLTQQEVGKAKGRLEDKAAETRAKLIDAKLRLAGWNVRDPSQVIQELDIDLSEAGTQKVAEPKTPYSGHQFAFLWVKIIE